MTMTQIATTKHLLKEGLYWEALGLAPNSDWHDTRIRIAEVELACRNDHEILTLLGEAGTDLRCSDYLAAWDLVMTSAAS